MTNIHPGFFSHYCFVLCAYDAQGRLRGTLDHIPVTRPGHAFRRLANANRRGYRTTLDVVDKSPY